MIGKLDYLACNTRSDMIMPVHKHARFCEDTSLFHEKNVKRVVKYLIGTKNTGIEENIDFSKGFVAFADSDFANGWNKLDADNTDNMFSRT